MANAVQGPAAASREGQLSLAPEQSQQARNGGRSEIARRREDSRAARQMGRRHDRQHAASRAQAPQAGVRRRRGVESPADLRRPHRLRRKGTGRQPAGVRHHRLLGSKRLALADTGCRRSADLAGRGQRRSRHGRRHLFRDRHGPVSARAHRQGLLRHDVAPRRGSLGLRRLGAGRAVQREFLSAARPQESTEHAHERVSRRG